MFAIKQVSLMALLIASAYAAPQLDSEENARNINTEDYINVSCGIIIVQCRKESGCFSDQIHNT